jgi:hypothetical protein
MIRGEYVFAYESLFMIVIMMSMVGMSVRIVRMMAKISVSVCGFHVIDFYMFVGWYLLVGFFG